MKRNRNGRNRGPKGFTLIELLVVISIIALLSGIVLASLNTARDKSSIAAGRQSEANIYHIAADRAVGIWDFNDCSGTSVADLSGLGNGGTLVNSTGASWSTDTPSGTGCSLSLNGTNQYVDFGNPTDIQFTGASQFTLSAWIKPTACVYPSSIFDKFGAKGYRIYLENGCQPSIQVRDSGGSIGQVTYTSGVTLGKWTFVTMVFDAGKVTFYVNGKSPYTGTLGVTMADLTRNAYIGQAPNNPGTYFQGNIDDVRIFSSVLSADAVERLYAFSMMVERPLGLF